MTQHTEETKKQTLTETTQEPKQEKNLKGDARSAQEMFKSFEQELVHQNATHAKKKKSVQETGTCLTKKEACSPTLYSSWR